MASTTPHSHSSTSTSAGTADVELRIPSERVYAAVVRTTAAGLAARLDFTIDDIEDLRISIGEAIALVVGHADPGSDLVCGFHLAPGTMTVRLSVPAGDEPVIDRDSFAWQVLDTMAEDVRAESRDGSLTVQFTVSSQATAGTPGAEL